MEEVFLADVTSLFQSVREYFIAHFRNLLLLAKNKRKIVSTVQLTL